LQIQHIFECIAYLSVSIGYLGHVHLSLMHHTNWLQTLNYVDSWQWILNPIMRCLAGGWCFFLFSFIDLLQLYEVGCVAAMCQSYLDCPRILWGISRLWLYTKITV